MPINRFFITDSFSVKWKRKKKQTNNMIRESYLDFSPSRFLVSCPHVVPSAVSYHPSCSDISPWASVLLTFNILSVQFCKGAVCSSDCFEAHWVHFVHYWAGCEHDQCRAILGNLLRSTASIPCYLHLVQVCRLQIISLDVLDENLKCKAIKDTGSCLV